MYLLYKHCGHSLCRIHNLSSFFEITARRRPKHYLDENDIFVKNRLEVNITLYVYVILDFMMKVKSRPKRQVKMNKKF